MPGQNPAEEFLDEEFPIRLRHFVPSALHRAYDSVSYTIETVSFLGTPGGRIQRGDLVAIAAEFEIERLVLNGDLPFDCSWEPYARPTGLHLVVRTRRAKLTIRQVEDGTKRPRDARFRENYGMANKPYLFEYMNKEMQDGRDPRHILLLHGYQTLSFAYVAVPHAKRKRHIAYSPNLMLIPHFVQGESKDEGPTDSPDPQQIDRLLRVIRDTEGSDD
jgi:hypothetical protein